MSAWWKSSFALPVGREARDADRNGRLDRLAGRFDLEPALGKRAADPLCDLERLLRRRLREQDRELLPAEAGRHVVVTQLLSEDIGDTAEDDVARKVAVRVVDVPEEVEVGHHQRQRTVEALRARQLVGQRCGEVACVVETRLRVDPRLHLEGGYGKRAIDHDERRECERDQPGIRMPERCHGDAERGKDELGGQRLDAEETRLRNRDAAAEAEHRREQRVVDEHVHDAGKERTCRDSEVRGRDQAVQAEHRPIHRERG
jgi:hypothetical protein